MNLRSITSPRGFWLPGSVSHVGGMMNTDRLDDDAIAFGERITASGGTIGKSALRAISNYCRDQKAAGLWAKKLYAWIPVGNFAASKLPLIVGSGSAQITLINITPSDYSETGATAGYKGDGTTKSFNTGWNPVTAGASVSNLTLSTYVRGVEFTAGASSRIICGASVGAADFLLLGWGKSGTAEIGGIGAASSAQYAPATSEGSEGYLSVTANGSRAQQYYAGGVARGSTIVASGALPNQPVYGLAYNASGAATSRSSRYIRALVIQAGLTAEEQLVDYEIMQRLQRALGRSVRSLRLTQPEDAGAVVLDRSMVSESDIHMRPRLFSIPADGTNIWWWFYAKLTGVQGLTPAFTISGGFGKFQASAENWVFSYDGETWTKFATRAASTFSHNSSFTEDTLYIAAARPFTSARMQAWVESLLTDDRVTPTTSGDASAVVGISGSGYTTDDSRVTTAKNIYGFKISDSSLSSGSVKKAVILTGGNHPGEHPAQWGLYALVNWILGGSAQAQTLLTHFDVFIYPNTNADGIYYGYTRTGPQSPISNHNRVWDTTGTFATVDTVKAAITSDTAGYGISAAFDFHSYNNGVNTRSYYDNTTAPYSAQSSALLSALGAYATVSSLGAVQSGSYAAYAADTIGAVLVFTPETQHLLGVQEDYEAYGVAWGKALSDVASNLASATP